MKIYHLENEAEDYRWLEYQGNWFDFFWNLLDSKPIGEFHEKIKCKTIRDKKERVLGDFPCFVVPAISEKAKNVLADYFGNLVEIFPLETGKLGKYYFMNIINILDCLDEANSDIIYFDNSDRIMKINSHSFKNFSDHNKLRIFKLKGGERGNIYVSEETKKLIDDANLEGFRFKEIGEIN